MHIYKYAGAVARSRYTGGGWWGLGLVVRLWTRCRASPILRCQLSDFSAMVDILHSFAIHDYVCVWWVCMSVCVLASWGGSVCMYTCMRVCTMYACMQGCTNVCMYTCIRYTYARKHARLHNHALYNLRLHTHISK